MTLSPRFGDGSVRVGYNGVPWSLSTSLSDVFYVEADPIRRHDISLSAEAIRAAREIGDLYHGEEIHVFYSGGYDSEAILEAFRMARVPVRAIIIEDEGGINARELAHAKQYLETTKFTSYDWITFSFDDWSNSADASSLAVEIQTPYSMQTFLCKPILERYRDKPVTIGHLPPVISYHKDRWWVTEPECFFSWWKFVLKYDVKGPPWFYWWDTELLNSWVGDPMWQLQLKNGVPGEDSTNSPLRTELMRRHFGLVPRQKVLWTKDQKTWNLTHSIYLRETIPVTYGQWMAEHFITGETGLHEQVR